MPLPQRAPCAVFHHPWDLRAGAGTRTRSLIQALRHRGWRIEASCEDGVAEHERLAINDLHADAAINREVDRLVISWRLLQPDVVHVEVPGPSAIAWQRAAQRLDLPLTTTFHRLHSMLPVHTSPTIRQDLIDFNHDFMRSCQRVLIELPSEKAVLAAQGIHRVAMSLNGIDARQFSPHRRATHLRATWQADATTTVLLFVGRVISVKGLDLLADTFLAVHQQFPTSRMVVVGDGSDRMDLAQRCPWVVFTGLLRGADLAAVYASGNILLFPSRVDSFGNAVTEAMASGLACVAFNRAAAGLLIQDDVNGRLVTTSAEFIAATLALVADPAHAQQLGTAAQTTSQTLTWESTAATTEAAFAQAIAEHRAKPEAEHRAKSETISDPLPLIVRAPLPEHLPAGATALLRRGHRLCWIDPSIEPLEMAGVLIDPTILTQPWSPPLAHHEARWSATHAGYIPPENPLKISLLTTGELAADTRVKRLARGLRRLGYMAEVTPATQADVVWRGALPDVVHLTAHSLHLAPLAQRLGIPISTVSIPEGVDVDLYNPYKRSSNLRHAWQVTDHQVVLLVLVSIADEATLHALHVLAPLTGYQLVAGCLTTTAAETLRTAGFTIPLIETISGAHLPGILASADIVMIPGPTPTRSAVLSVLASGGGLLVAQPLNDLPIDVYIELSDFLPTVAETLRTQLPDCRAAGRRYAERHTWTDSAQSLLSEAHFLAEKQAQEKPLTTG